MREALSYRVTWFRDEWNPERSRPKSVIIHTWPAVVAKIARLHECDASPLTWIKVEMRRELLSRWTEVPAPTAARKGGAR